MKLKTNYYSDGRLSIIILRVFKNDLSLHRLGYLVSISDKKPLPALISFVLIYLSESCFFTLLQIKLK